MNCPSCGAGNADYAVACLRCGMPLPIARSVHGLETPARPAPATAADPPQGRGAYGGFWRRLAGYTVDYGVALLLVYALFGGVDSNGADPESPQGALLMAAAVLLYHVAMLASPFQATVGKLAVGLKVTTARGERIGIVRALARCLTQMLSMLTGGLGYLLIAITPRRQGLHDLLVGTVVRHRGEQPAPAWIVAAVCLLGLVPIVGMLAAIAIPAYQDYSIRAQVGEGLALADAYKAPIEEAWAATADFENVSSSSLPSDLAAQGLYVESIDVVSGAIVITYGAAAHQTLQGLTLTIVPALDLSGEQVAWQCGRGRAPDGFEPIFEDPARFTDLPDELLPADCRRN